MRTRMDLAFHRFGKMYHILKESSPIKHKVRLKLLKSVGLEITCRALASTIALAAGKYHMPNNLEDTVVHQKPEH